MRGDCRPHWPRRSGITLIEILVVIAVIGILIALLFPAIQAARESARRITCANHLKQLSLGCQQHLESHQHFPSGGWGWHWVGDPDRGYGKRQPGGWFYNVLPYIEQAPLHDLGASQPESVKRVAANERVRTPLALASCPTKRSNVLFAKPWDGLFVAINAADNDPAQNVAARSDYAANAGNQSWDEYFPGPPSLNVGDQPTFAWHDLQACNGISFERSEVKAAQVRDGMSCTILLGEKYLNPEAYATGMDVADNENLYTGYNNDNFRVASWAWPPIQDRVGYSSSFSFGSAHIGVCQFALCDGSVRSISHNIDPATYHSLGGRNDGGAVDSSQY